MVTTRTFGNAGCSRAPAGYPNAAALAGVSGTSSSNPSMAISRQWRRNAPRVSSPATGPATRSNSSSSGSGPSRLRAWVIPPEVGVLHESSQHPHDARVSVSRAATSS